MLTQGKGKMLCLQMQLGDLTGFRWPNLTLILSAYWSNAGNFQGTNISITPSLNWSKSLLQQDTHPVSSKPDTGGQVQFFTLSDLDDLALCTYPTTTLERHLKGDWERQEDRIYFTVERQRKTHTITSPLCSSHNTLNIPFHISAPKQQWHLITGYLDLEEGESIILRNN